MLLLLFSFRRYGQTNFVSSGFHSKSLTDVRQCWTNQHTPGRTKPLYRIIIDDSWVVSRIIYGQNIRHNSATAYKTVRFTFGTCIVRITTETRSRRHWVIASLGSCVALAWVQVTREDRRELVPQSRRRRPYTMLLCCPGNYLLTQYFCDW